MATFLILTVVVIGVALGVRWWVRLLDEIVFDADPRDDDDDA